MFKFFKWLPSLFKLKSVAEVYKEEEGKEKPAYISRRFVGALLLAASGLSAQFLGFELTQEQIDTMSGLIETIGVGVMGLYSLVMIIVGIVKRGQ